jgi:hypothetical protein
MGHASLDYDRVTLTHPSLSKLGPHQVYRDALTATLTSLQSERDHSHQFLEQLGWQMSTRDLATYDEILLPNDKPAFAVLLKLIERDLTAIAK